MIATTVSTSLLIKAGITIAILQFVESNILSPYIVGKSLRMHPVIIMLALLVGGGSWDCRIANIGSDFSSYSHCHCSCETALEKEDV